MATGGRRDDAALVEGLARWMAAHPEQVPTVRGDPESVATIASIGHAEGGQANETVLIDLGPERSGVVARLPPLQPTFPDYELAPQSAVQNALAASGVPAPAPSVTVSDPQWIGAPFLAMPLVRGDIAGPAPVFDGYVTGADPVLQRRMYDGLIDTVVSVHAVDWGAAGLGQVLAGTTLHGALDRWTAYVDWSSAGAPLPALTEALEWCAARVPDDTGPVLLWGDVRLGNLVFDEERRVRAVLDWDLASIGPAEMDLGWHFGLEYMMESLFGRRVDGFPRRAEAVARYEEASGRVLSDLDWHEVFALVRALAINDRHQRISGDTRRTENPMGAILLARMSDADVSGLRLGIAHHLGWAVAVTASADHDVVDRRRLELIEPGLPAAPVHHEGGPHDLHRPAEPLSDEALAALVAEVRASVVRATTEAFDDLQRTLAHPIVSLSLRAWPADFPTDIAVVRRVPFESRADSVMYRAVMAELGHARGWADQLL